MKDILKSLRRNPYQTLAGFSVLFFSLFLSSVIFISLVFINGLLNYLETRPQVTVYFQPKTPENNILKIRDELASSGKTLAINYIDQKQAFEIYKNINKDNPLLLEMVSPEIFPPSLEIYAKKPIFLPEIAEYLKKQGDIDEVQYQKDLVDKLLTITNVLRKGSLVFFSYLILMSILVLTTTTSFKIALKKDEIELLKLIGASDSYIRKPYIKEGLFMGVAATSLSFLIILIIFLYSQTFLKSYLVGIPDLTLEIYSVKFVIWPFNLIFFITVFLLTLIFGSAIAIISSYLAINKYLKI